MLRDKNLIPLSHQHQHALALCVRIQRAIEAGAVDLEGFQAEIQQMFEQEIAIHFAAEEKELFPAAEKLGLKPLVDELLDDHAALRNYFSRAKANSLDRASLQAFAEELTAHVRKEERQLFEEMQANMKPDDSAKLGTALQQALQDAPQGCIVPTEKTRLRPRQTK